MRITDWTHCGEFAADYERFCKKNKIKTKDFNSLCRYSRKKLDGNMLSSAAASVEADLIDRFGIAV